MSVLGSWTIVSSGGVNTSQTNETFAKATSRLIPDYETEDRLRQGRNKSMSLD